MTYIIENTPKKEISDSNIFATCAKNGLPKKSKSMKIVPEFKTVQQIEWDRKSSN